MRIVLPPLLAPGARVALVAPSGPLAGAPDLEQALENARSFGWEPVVGVHALSRHACFAGRDDERLVDLNRMVCDATIDAIWFLRGGYGAMRLLDGIDYEALRRRPKALIGYSDITAIHCAVHHRLDLVTYHGPTARSPLTPFTRDSLHRAVIAGADPAGVASGATPVRGGRAAGRIAGGNLALLAALSGTAYAPKFNDAIVCLEDINEAPYRVDRMLRQLLLAGAFDHCRALVFGDFSGAVPDSSGWTTDDVLGEFANLLGVPALRGVPLGHIEDQWTLPLGAMAEVDVDERCVRTSR